MGRWCKTCALLRRKEWEGEYRYACGWREQIVIPWAEGMLNANRAGSGIGKRHVEGDWSEVMDCQTHVVIKEARND